MIFPLTPPMAPPPGRIPGPRGAGYSAVQASLSIDPPRWPRSLFESRPPRPALERLPAGLPHPPVIDVAVDEVDRPVDQAFNGLAGLIGPLRERPEERNSSSLPMMRPRPRSMACITPDSIIWRWKSRQWETGRPSGRNTSADLLLAPPKRASSWSNRAAMPPWNQCPWRSAFKLGNTHPQGIASMDLALIPPRPAGSTPRRSACHEPESGPGPGGRSPGPLPRPTPMVESTRVVICLMVGSSKCPQADEGLDSLSG